MPLPEGYAYWESATAARRYLMRASNLKSTCIQSGSTYFIDHQFCRDLEPVPRYVTHPRRARPQAMDTTLQYGIPYPSIQCNRYIFGGFGHHDTIGP